MTGPTPAPPPKNEGEYARKLALAILSTLENKGLLTRLDVDTILHVAHRAANAAPAVASPALSNPAVLNPAPATPEAVQPPPAPAAAPPSVTVLGEAKGPASLGTRWVKPEDASHSAAPVVATLPSAATAQEATAQEASAQEANAHASAAAQQDTSGGQVIVIPAPQEGQEPESQGQQPAAPAFQPPVIDFTLD